MRRKWQGHAEKCTALAESESIIRKVRVEYPYKQPRMEKGGQQILVAYLNTTSLMKDKQKIILQFIMLVYRNDDDSATNNTFTTAHCDFQTFVTKCREIDLINSID